MDAQVPPRAAREAAAIALRQAAPRAAPRWALHARGRRHVDGAARRQSEDRGRAQYQFRQDAGALPRAAWEDARRMKCARAAPRDCQTSGSFVPSRKLLTGSTPMRLALLFLLATAAPAVAQSSKSDPPPADFKPLVQPLLLLPPLLLLLLPLLLLPLLLLPPLLLPPNSYISPGAVTGDPITPYSSTPGYDAAR